MTSDKDTGLLTVGLAQIAPIWLNRGKTLEKILDGGDAVMANGGFCLAGPDGEWWIEPVIDRETLLVATIDHARVREERQNFDPAGHYARPDVTRLTINRRRQSTIAIDE